MNKVHGSAFLKLSYDHKDMQISMMRFSIIMKNFSEPFGLETNSSLRDGSKCQNSGWERDVCGVKI